MALTKNDKIELLKGVSNGTIPLAELRRPSIKATGKFLIFEKNERTGQFACEGIKGSFSFETLKEKLASTIRPGHIGWLNVMDNKGHLSAIIFSTIGVDMAKELLN